MKLLCRHRKKPERCIYVKKNREIYIVEKIILCPFTLKNIINYHKLKKLGRNVVGFLIEIAIFMGKYMKTPILRGRDICRIQQL